jgi:ribose 5-phosphate isomerase B
LTATGASIAANKVPGIRAALCDDAKTAEAARRWNDANVLALSLRSSYVNVPGPAAGT